MYTVFSLSKSGTSTALNLSELLLLLFGLLLVAGLIGEYAESDRWKRYVKVFEMCVIIGVAGELIADGGIFLFSSHLQTIADLEIGALTKQAHDAKISAEGAASAASNAKSSAEAASGAAGEAIEKANGVAKQAGTLKAQLSDIQKDTLALGPRWRLLKSGEDTFVKALKPFAGQRVTVVICGQDDGERSQLEQTLLNLFPKAGWEKPGYMRWNECPLWMTGGNDMYFVASAPSADGNWAESYPCRLESDRVGIEGAAKALCDVLNKLNISTRAFKEKTAPNAAMKARAFWAQGSPGSPGEIAFSDPTMIFLVIGLNQPIFADEQKRRQKLNVN
jgi:hypothetical protein